MTYYMPEQQDRLPLHELENQYLCGFQTHQDLRAESNSSKFPVSDECSPFCKLRKRAAVRSKGDQVPSVKSCPICRVIRRQRQHREQRKTINYEHELGRDLHNNSPSEYDIYGYLGRDWDEGQRGEALVNEEMVEAELYRLGLLYVNAQDRGAGTTFDVITPKEPMYSVAYKPMRPSRPRRRLEKTPDAPLSPAMSYVDISSDEELAAFLSVYDYVDIGDDESLYGECEGI